jgi:hypothetical protein
MPPFAFHTHWKRKTVGYRTVPNFVARRFKFRSFLGIQKGKNGSRKRKKYQDMSCFDELDVLFGRLEASPEA